MKIINLKNLTILLGITVLLACSDDDNDFPRAVTLKVVNAINEVPSVIVNTAGDSITYSITSSKVGFGSNRRYSITTDRPQELIIVPESDTLNIIYQDILELQPAGYSLFLIGSAGNEDDLLVQDNYRQIQDSIVGVRFVNLSPNASSLNIGITGETSDEVTGLGYTQLTDYLEFPATGADGPYAFEFKDGSGNVLATFNLAPVAKRNLTLAVVGPDDSALSVSQINNF